MLAGSKRIRAHQPRLWGLPGFVCLLSVFSVSFFSFVQLLKWIIQTVWIFLNYLFYGFHLNRNCRRSALPFPFKNCSRLWKSLRHFRKGVFSFCWIIITAHFCFCRFLLHLTVHTTPVEAINDNQWQKMTRLGWFDGLYRSRWVDVVDIFTFKEQTNPCVCVDYV